MISLRELCRVLPQGDKTSARPIEHCTGFSFWEVRDTFSQVLVDEACPPRFNTPLFALRSAI